MLFSKISTFSSGNLWEQILNWYQNSLIKELLDHFENNVFNLDPSVYEHFTLTAETSSSIKNIIIGLVIGMVLASGMACYTRAVQGKFVRELLKRECFTPESAVTLRQCGFFCNPSIRRELSKGGALSKITRTVSTAEETPTSDDGNEATAERTNTNSDNTSVDFLTARYYIPEEEKYRAEFRYRQQGSRVPHLLLTVVICVLVAVLLFRGLPVLLTFADWLISVFS